MKNIFSQTPDFSAVTRMLIGDAGGVAAVLFVAVLDIGWPEGGRHWWAVSSCAFFGVATTLCLRTILARVAGARYAARGEVEARHHEEWRKTSVVIRVLLFLPFSVCVSLLVGTFSHGEPVWRFDKVSFDNWFVPLVVLISLAVSQKIVSALS